MSTLSLRLLDSLHQGVRELVKKGGISINPLVATAAAEKLSALMTEDYLAAQTRRASREKYEAALAQIPDVEPEPRDRGGEGRRPRIQGLRTGRPDFLWGDLFGGSTCCSVSSKPQEQQCEQRNSDDSIDDRKQLEEHWKRPHLPGQMNPLPLA